MSILLNAKNLIVTCSTHTLKLFLYDGRTHIFFLYKGQKQEKEQAKRGTTEEAEDMISSFDSL